MWVFGFPQLVGCFAGGDANRCNTHLAFGRLLELIGYEFDAHKFEEPGQWCTRFQRLSDSIKVASIYRPVIMRAPAANPPALHCSMELSALNPTRGGDLAESKGEILEMELAHASSSFQ